jgi:hypothetical protein
MARDTRRYEMAFPDSQTSKWIGKAVFLMVAFPGITGLADKVLPLLSPQ